MHPIENLQHTTSAITIYNIIILSFIHCIMTLIINNYYSISVQRIIIRSTIKNGITNWNGLKTLYGETKLQHCVVWRGREWTLS